MAIRMNFNPSAVLASANLSRADRSMSQVMARITSGLRMTRAADDPAGMTIANLIRNDISGITAATSNGEDGISMLQTAEGAIDGISTLLLRARELAVNAANSAILDLPQRQALQADLDEVVASIDRIAGQTRFGDQTLLDGSLSGNVLDPDATAFLDAIDHDDTRLPGGIQPGSELTLAPPSGDLTRESIAVVFQNGGVPAAADDPISGLTQDGTALSIAGGEQITVTGPDGSQSIDLTPALRVGDLAAIINARTGHTGLRAAYDAPTGTFTLESTSFGSGALHVAATDDLSGGGNVGLLDTDTTSALGNPLEPTRDAFTMTLQNGGVAAAASDPLGGLTGDGNLFDAVDDTQLHLFGRGEMVSIGLEAGMTVSEVVDAINATTGTTGAVANYDAGTGQLTVTGSSGPLHISSDDLTSGGSTAGLLDLRTDLLDDAGAARISTAPQVTADLTVTDADGTTRTVELTTVPGVDGGRTLVNLLPGPEMSPPWTGFEPGAFRVTVRDTSDGSMGSSIVAPSSDLSATRERSERFQTGARTGETIAFEIPDMRAGALGHAAGLAVDELANLQDLVDRDVFIDERGEEAIRVIDAAIDEVAAARGRLGVTQAQGLEQIVDTLRLGSENLTASESRIRDADMAHESAQFARHQVQLQAATAMLGQANQIPQSVLQLLNQ